MGESAMSFCEEIVWCAIRNAAARPRDKDGHIVFSSESLSK